MNKHMIHRGDKQSFKCIRCFDYKHNAPKYLWIGLVTKEDLGEVCQKCAIIESYGSNYRNNKKYQQWRKNNGKA
jgi:hypothetical protein